MPSHASMFTGLLPRAAGLSRAPGEMPSGCRPVLEAAAGPVPARGAAARRLPHPRRQLEHLGRRGERLRHRLRRVARRHAEPGRPDGLDAARAARPLGARRAARAQRRRRRGGRGGAARLVRRTRRPARVLVREPDRVPLARTCRRSRSTTSARSTACARRRRRAGTSRSARSGACAWPSFDVPDDALERMRHLYDRSIRQLDAWVARHARRRSTTPGKLDDTLVLVCSDHGENFGEGGLLGHAYSLDERLLHVPFIASGPNAPSDDEEPGRAAARGRGRGRPRGAPVGPREPAAVAVAQFDSPGERDDPRKLDAIKAWGAGPGGARQPERDHGVRRPRRDEAPAARRRAAAVRPGRRPARGAPARRHAQRGARPTCSRRSRASPPAPRSRPRRHGRAHAPPPRSSPASRSRCGRSATSERAVLSYRKTADQARRAARAHHAAVVAPALPRVRRRGDPLPGRTGSSVPT